MVCPGGFQCAAAVRFWELQIANRLLSARLNLNPFVAMSQFRQCLPGTPRGTTAALDEKSQSIAIYLHLRCPSFHCPHGSIFLCTFGSLLAAPTANFGRNDFEISRHPVEPAGSPIRAMRLGVAGKESDSRFRLSCCIHHYFCEIHQHVVEGRAFKWPPAVEWSIRLRHGRTE